MDAPSGIKLSQTMAKISKSYILTLPHRQGHVMSVKCKQPLDELTVQVWLLFYHSNFKYCTSYVSRMDLRTDRQTDDLITRCPWGIFQALGHKKFRLKCTMIFSELSEILIFAYSHFMGRGGGGVNMVKICTDHITANCIIIYWYKGHSCKIIRNERSNSFV